MKKASKRRILFAARMATMVGAACFAVSGISETLGQEKEKSRPVYIATEGVAETTYMPEVEETTQPSSRNRCDREIVKEARQMSQPLFPVVEVPDFISEDSQYDTQYKRSMKWDPELGDFVRDGAHRIKECDGKEAFAIWCFKIAQTERYRCLAYPDSIGTEMERAMDNDDEKTVESMAERTITDAIMVNPRAENVRDFQFTWEGDQMHVTFKVKGSNWDEEIEISL